ncbi:MAG: response regulator [Acidobacteria bacterium RIFCSPLOWO2_12_FULL_67_14b]|nr:MAG: response regulator [Acidobacteria bacterium RIFCSPLOWO2_12_FULL_67_14b]
MENSEPTPRGDAARILIVDDDALFAESLQQNLGDAGYAVTTFGDGPAALAYLADGGGGDLVLLDWKMPGMNGIEVLRRLRDQGSDIPVIFLTVLSDQIYEEAALLGGAVDFVEKSRSFSILRKRIELSLGRNRAANGVATHSEDTSLRVGRLELQLDSSRALWNGQQVYLSLTEFRMVHYMAARSGMDVRYRELYDIVHGEGFVAGEGTEGYRANVRTFVKRIRQKFRDMDPSFDRIGNYPGFGYRWQANGSNES